MGWGRHSRTTFGRIPHHPLIILRQRFDGCCYRRSPRGDPIPVLGCSIPNPFAYFRFAFSNTERSPPKKSVPPDPGISPDCGLWWPTNLTMLECPPARPGGVYRNRGNRLPERQEFEKPKGFRRGPEREGRSPSLQPPPRARRPQPCLQLPSSEPTRPQPAPSAPPPRDRKPWGGTTHCQQVPHEGSQTRAESEAGTGPETTPPAAPPARLQTPGFIYVDFLTLIIWITLIFDRHFFNNSFM